MLPMADAPDHANELGDISSDSEERRVFYAALDSFR